MAVTTLHPHKKPMKLPAGYAPNTSLAHENPKTMERLKSISFHCLVATFERFGWVRQMADAIGCSPSTIHNYLRGTRPSPGIEELCRKWLAENDYPIPSPKVEHTPPVQAIPTPEKAPEIPNKLEVPQYPKPFNPPAPKPAQEAEQPRLNLEAPTAPKVAPKAAAGDMAIMAMIMGPRAGVEKLLQAAQIWGLTVDFEE